jgi:predicted O-methyltransferase YrrM
VDIKGILKEIEIQAKKELLPIIGPEKGKILAEMVGRYKPKRILEIGTLVGYSAILMAENLPDEGEIITLEVSQPSFEMAKENIQKAGLEDKIKIIFGSALEIIPTLNVEFDFVFIDAEKKEYLKYLKAVEPKLSSQAIVVADNIGKFKEKMHDYLEYVRGSGKYQSQTIDFGYDAMEVSEKNSKVA